MSAGVTIGDNASATLTLDDDPTASVVIGFEGDLDMSQYDIGDGILLHADFKNSAGQAANPTAVELRLKLPTGGVSTLSPTNPTTGRWEATFLPTAAGRYDYRFTGTGTVAASEEKHFTVRKRVVN